MLLRVHTVPLDARDGNEAEPDDDHFSIVSSLCGLAMWFSLQDTLGNGLEVSLDLLLFHFSYQTPGLPELVSPAAPQPVLCLLVKAHLGKSPCRQLLLG